MGIDPNNVVFNSVLFKELFPPVVGEATALIKSLTHVLTNPEQPNVWKPRVKKDNINFPHHDANNNNPDFLVKIFLTLMVTAVLEFHKGIEGLWQRGNSSWMKDCLNYGQFIPKDYFIAFLHGIPLVRTEILGCESCPTSF